jgi:4'-phosphopantetheinyl transferase
LSLIDWSNAPREFLLRQGTPHVWRLNVEPEESLFSKLSSVLSTDEKVRADRFVFDKDRNMFVAVRGTLRFLLGRYCDVHPNDIVFSYNSYGKPQLEFPKHDIQFNISHSQNIAVLVFAFATVGIDVEYQEPKFASVKIAERFFSTIEVEELKSASERDMIKLFFDCWSRKESYIKAKGMGISLPLESFATRSVGHDKAVLLHSHQFPNDVKNLEIVPFIPCESFSAAFTVEKPVEQIFYFNCNDFLNSIRYATF